uniref:Bm430 n=1 Tax=Brugia malayi TaxID=6279 RepID=A0A1I9G1S1_BRUMA|nr:Bm430 [Brugia malayi]
MTKIRAFLLPLLATHPIKFNYLLLCIQKVVQSNIYLWYL